MTHIENLCKSFPELRREAVVKAEALRMGVKIEGETLEAFMSKAWVRKAPVFSWSWEESKSKVQGKPEHFELPEGTVCMVRPNPNSPYSIVLMEGRDDRCVLYENGEPIIEVLIPPANKLWHETLSDGTPLPLIVEHVSGDGAGVIVHSMCSWKDGEECKFCDAVVRGRRAVKRKDPNFIARKKPELVAEAYELLFKEGGIIHQNLTGGAIPDHYDGKTDTEFYLEYLEAIGSRVDFPDSYAIAVIAKDKEDAKKIRATGIKMIAMNLEVWDPKLFTILCPGKNRLIGRDAYVQNLIDAVDVFGPGNVVTDFVVGVEMCRPYGFKDVDEALKSSLGGYEYLMQRGVVPRGDYWVSEELSALGSHQTTPPSEFFLRLSIGTHELLEKYGLPPSPFFCRKCSVVDPIHDLY